MKKQNGVFSSVSRAIGLVVPFILIATAIVCLTLWLFNSVIASSSLYRALTLGFEGSEETKYIDITENYDKLYDQNEGDGFYTPQEFPIIPYGSQWATITIEAADLYSAPVVQGDSKRLLLKNVCKYTESRFPGLNGKCVLSAHVSKGHFAKLETLVVGDVIELDTTYGKYTYTVTETHIIKDTDGFWLRPEDGKDMLYLYTCYPAVSLVRRTQRFLVIAEKTSGENWMGGLEHD